ncbi:MAG: cytochrome c peroxidase [Paracoccaceae bacterium]
MIVPLLLVTPVSASDLASLPAPLTASDFLQFDPKQAALGHKLFYDPILSGNRNISCAHCHHPDHGTGDGLSLGIGEGGKGLGTKRTAGTGDAKIRKRIPRNAPGLWNLAARDIHTMFHDGRLSISDRYENGFDSPAEEWLPTGFNSLLAAQAVFPLIAQFEMAGNPAENEIIGAVHDRIDKAWPIIAKRVRVSGDYGVEFVDAFAHIQSPEQVSIVEIVNALAAFMALEWTSFDSPYDQYIAGNLNALNASETRGLKLFFGAGGCSECHSGKLLSDQKFHALTLPPFGPGRTRMFDPYARDVGRMGETDRIEDAYRFRTPMLRNVALTGPYGHNGAFPTLEAMIKHHLDPVASFQAWRPAKAQLPDVPWLAATDFVIWQDSREMQRQSRVRDVHIKQMRDDEVADLVAFMHALTGTDSIAEPTFGVPKSFRP